MREPDLATAEEEASREDLGRTTLRLARHFAGRGAAAAGSAAAATGAVAAGLLEWTAALSARRGSADFRRRARAIAGRAAALQTSLGRAARADGELVERWMRERGASAELRHAAADSALEIAAHCARVATLAAEIAQRGHPPARPDAAAVLRLAAAAGDCGLQLAEEDLRSPVADERRRRAARRIWRTRLLLQRALATLGGSESP